MPAREARETHIGITCSPTAALAGWTRGLLGYAVHFHHEGVFLLFERELLPIKFETGRIGTGN